MTAPPAVSGATATLAAPTAAGTAVAATTAVAALITTSMPTAAPTAPATLTPVPTVTATITPTLAPSATPDGPPSARLAKARQLQEIGDCDAARREFAGLIAPDGQASSDLTPDEAAEARYYMAQCYLRDDAYSEAATVLQDLLSAAPAANAFRAPASFLLGEAQKALQDWPAAEAGYTDYLKAEPELASFAWQRIAGVRRSADNLAGATAALNEALNASPDWTNTVAIRRALADIALQQGDGRAAAAQYELLRNGQTSGAWAAEMLWLIGSALNRAGDTAGAIQRWQAATDADPTSRFAYSGLVALVDAGVPVDDFKRGVIDYHADAYLPAISALERVMAGDSTGHQGEAWYYVGLSYIAVDEYDKGAANLGNFLAAYPSSPLANTAWMALANAQANAGNTSAAIDTYRKFAADHPAAAQAPLALWTAATMEEDEGLLSNAAPAYLDLARRYPGSDYGWRAYLAAGLDWFRMGNYAQAGDAWNQMAQAPQLDTWTRAVAYFWLGRAQWATGEQDAARQSWRQAAQAAPNDYYGLRAAALAAGQPASLTPAPASGNADALPKPSPDELAAWLRSWAGEGSLALPATVAADPDWRRGQALLKIGLRSSGIAAWTRLEERYSSSPWAMGALALAFADTGEYRLSIECAAQLAALAPAGSTLPAALLRLEYPLPYTDLIYQQAARWGIDPLLVASVIRQESRFEGAAISSAAAQGLMQVIPDTAQWIATRLQWPNYTPDQIYWPYVNVTFGTYYLAEQLKAFDGSAAAALAAYNGGPGNAARWRRLAPSDDDLMVAQIDLSESRLYVQLVWENYQMYQKLYR